MGRPPVGRAVIVRPAGPADGAAWVRCRHRLWPHRTAEELAETVEAFFGAGTALVAAVFVAWEADTPVGFVELSLRAYVPGARQLPAPFVEGWYVEPAARGRGVGRALIEAAQQWAHDHGHRQLGSDTALDNVDSLGAHRALGFREVEAVRFLIKELIGR